MNIHNMNIHSLQRNNMPFCDKLPSRTLVYTTIAITIGSAFEHGFYTAVLNTPHKALRAWTSSFLMQSGYNSYADSVLIVKILWSVSSSLYFLGGIFGALIAGSTIDKFDRKKVIFATCGIILVPQILMIIAYLSGVTLLFIGSRLLLGIISGVFSCAVPIYLAEISPVAIRGMVSSWYYVMYSIGVCSAFVLGHPSTLGDDLWIILMLVPIVPLGIQMAMMQYCPVSPRFLLIKEGKYDEAMKVLKWLRRIERIDALEEELNEIANELEDYFLYRAVRNVRWIQLLTLKYMRKPMLISIMMMCAQQLCGIDVFLLHSSQIFEDTGLPSTQAYYGTLVIGGAFLLVSILSMLLIEVAGRRMLLCYGYIGIFIFSLVHYLTYLYNKDAQECIGSLAALFILFFFAHYALGPSSIPWFMVAEMFNQASRPKAMAVAACCNWFMNSVVAISFWPLYEYAGAHVFLIYLLFQIMFFFLILKYVPETKNKSITAITEKYK